MPYGQGQGIVLFCCRKNTICEHAEDGKINPWIPLSTWIVKTPPMTGEFLFSSPYDEGRKGVFPYEHAYKHIRFFPKET